MTAVSPETPVTSPGELSLQSASSENPRLRNRVAASLRPSSVTTNVPGAITPMMWGRSRSLWFSAANDVESLTCSKTTRSRNTFALPLAQFLIAIARTGGTAVPVCTVSQPTICSAVMPNSRAACTDRGEILHVPSMHSANRRSRALPTADIGRLGEMIPCSSTFQSRRGSFVSIPTPNFFAAPWAAWGVLRKRCDPKARP